ncbi:MAG: TetR/AcrR family transcriptional regulator, partial [Parvibaculaceae bacterium]|nr:TetR/AcrR family transcriptional regulator [Parvibaculaceae bacterium]
MKTRDRILKNSLLLFNQDGEANVSTVDIANEVDISPGNLYYHFRGKEVIIPELFSSYEEEMRIVLEGPFEKPFTIEDNWVYLYVVFEEIFDFRFFYRNLNDLLGRFPDLARRFREIVARKNRAIVALTENLQRQGMVTLSDPQKESLALHITMVMTYWLNFATVMEADDDGPA